MVRGINKKIVIVTNEIENINFEFAKAIISETGSGCFLDCNNINWRFVDGEFIGKRSVWTFDFRACWLEETTPENVKSWWCGKDADYSEVFTKKGS